MHSSLERHYAEKYAAESTRPGERLVPIVRRPRDRFEAAVSTMTRQLPPGAHVLEIGAGDGTIAASLAKHRQDISLVVSDSARERVDGLTKRFADEPRVTTMLLDAEASDKATKPRFDAVILVALIEHFVDPIAAMNTVRSNLKPGGIVYIDTPNIAKWTRRIKLLLGRFPSTASTNEGLTRYDGHAVDLHDEGHLHYFTFRSMTMLLEEFCGFTDCSPHPYWVGVGHHVGSQLAILRPSMFSELAVTARLA